MQPAGGKNPACEVKRPCPRASEAPPLASNATKPGTKQPGQASIVSGGFQLSLCSLSFDFCRLFSRLSAREGRQNSRSPAQAHFLTGPKAVLYPCAPGFCT